MASILVSITWWWDKGADVTEQRGCLRSGELAVSRKNWNPQLGWKRNLQLSGVHGSPGNKPNRHRALLGAARFIFDLIPSGSERISHCLCLWVQAGLSLWEILPVPAGGWCGEGGRRKKTSCDEDRLHGKMQGNAVESQDIKL